MIAHRATLAATLVLAAAVLVGPGSTRIGTSPSDRAPAVTAPVAVAAAPPAGRPSVPRATPPAPEPARTAMAPSAPVRLTVPDIDVDSELVPLGLQPDGSLEVPQAAFPAGWFTGAPMPGEIGPAVIAGHIDWVTGPGVFARLGALTPGAEIRVSRTDGTVAVFRVVSVAQYPKDAFPTDLVYGDLDHAGLRLISCGGAFDRRTGHYEDNIVVFADLVL